MAKIGIFDSGIGGLTNLFSLVEKYQHHYIYVGDQKNSPYGSKSEAELFFHSCKIVEFLIEKDCKTIIVACNTICATVLPKLKKTYPEINFISVIEPTVDAINRSNYQKLLLIATEATVKSGAYLKNNQKEIIALATPLLVPAIESMDSTINNILNDYLMPYQNKIDAVVLGCTHYPIIKENVQKIIKKDTIDSIQLIGNLIKQEQEPLQIEIYTTQNCVRMNTQIKHIFNIAIKSKLLEV